METPVITEEDPEFGLNAGNIEGGHANSDKMSKDHKAGGIRGATTPRSTGASTSSPSRRVRELPQLEVGDAEWRGRRDGIPHDHMGVLEHAVSVRGGTDRMARRCIPCHSERATAREESGSGSLSPRTRGERAGVRGASIFEHVRGMQDPLTLTLSPGVPRERGPEPDSSLAVARSE